MNTEKPSIVRRLYDWVLHWADTPYGFTALVLISFVESSFFPIPPDVLLMALVLAAPTKWAKIAFACTLASVAGGVAGYGIGVLAWDTMGMWIVENLVRVPLTPVDGRMDIALPAYMTKMFGDSLGGSYLFQVYDTWGAWIVGIFGLTPLPYKLVTITAGVAQLNLPVFIITSIVARGFRFFVVSYILFKVGEPAKAFIDKHFNKLTIIFVVLLIGGFAVLKLIF
ncbi:YqaA family protein [Pseudobacteriovorax antillogorgiicola]|nr:DedA family protein [Pseudobacteriovorax antillogorgiicola]